MNNRNFIRLGGFNICGSFKIRERDLLHQSLEVKGLEGRNVKGLEGRNVKMIKVLYVK